MTHHRTSLLSRALSTAAAAAALALAPLGASAFDSVVIFGDSLSDSGNNAIVLGAAPDQVVTGNSYVPTFAYGSGTYSNGEVWATTFASALGLQALPSLGGGTNYAYGGAVTRGGVYPPSLRDQVGQYLSAGAPGAGDALFVIAGGGNNARSALEAISTGAPPVQTVLQTALRYAYDVGLMVDQLQAAGAQDIVVWNTPDLGLVPAVVAEGELAMTLGTLVSSAMNNALARRLEGEQGVLTFDVFGLLRQAAGDPAAFGLANVSDACGAVLGCDPDTYLFWDGIHPTSGGHAILTQGMLAVVAVPEPGTALMFVFGAAGLVAWRRRRA